MYWEIVAIEIGDKKDVIKNKSHQGTAADDSIHEKVVHGGNQ